MGNNEPFMLYWRETTMLELDAGSHVFNMRNSHGFLRHLPMVPTQKWLALAPSWSAPPKHACAVDGPSAENRFEMFLVTYTITIALMSYTIIALRKHSSEEMRGSVGKRGYYCRIWQGLEEQVLSRSLSYYE
jgi:hypothetical protein